ncbi:MAG: sigma-70 family RNA polymerase sigma factor [Chromatiales bacterium]
MEDRLLLEQIASGREAAMETFYRRYSNNVYGFAMKTLHNPVDAAEILNEVMLEVWKKASNYAGKSSVKTWLLSITHHKAVDLVRRNSRHDHEDETHIDESAQGIAGSLLDGALADERGVFVRQCMEGLSQSHRQVVHLTFFEECSYPEIAETLDIPQGTVKTRMMHAKKKLFDCLKKMLGMAAKK